MRAIKFRAWDVLSKTMDEDAQAKFWLSQGFDQEEFKDSYVFMQYTGLKDKNGVEIYEGDILKHCIYNAQGVMQWDGKASGWTRFLPLEEFKIIGNIYENPDLLNSEPEDQRSVARDGDSSTSDNKQRIIEGL